MGYDDYKLATPPDHEPNEKECDECEGRGYHDESYCCGASIDHDTLICHECNDHSDFMECDECKGTGIIINDLIY